jgi:epsin
LFAARDGDGVDTFGNVGALRYAARSFFTRLRVNDVRATFFSRSFGQTEYGKLAAQKTGAVPQNSFNPFAQQQQQQQQQQQTHNNEQPFFTI